MYLDKKRSISSLYQEAWMLGYAALPLRWLNQTPRQCCILGISHARVRRAIYNGLDWCHREACGFLVSASPFSQNCMITCAHTFGHRHCMWLSYHRERCFGEAASRRCVTHCETVPGAPDHSAIERLCWERLHPTQTLHSVSSCPRSWRSSASMFAIENVLAEDLRLSNASNVVG